MGSLVVKLDKPTLDKIKNGNRYSDIDILNARQGGNDVVLGELPMAYDVDAVKASMKFKKIYFYEEGMYNGTAKQIRHYRFR